MKQLHERDIEKYLCQCVRERGGEIRKVSWVGRAHAPDRFVMLYETRYLGSDKIRYRRETFWVELKAPGEVPTPGQLREHKRMRDAGARVEVVDSLEGVAELFK